MSEHTTDFSLQIEGVNGSCPAGERYAEDQIANDRVPVLSCEGPCLRGDIARRAANLVAKEVPGYARACHAEAFFVPHSAMRRWIGSANRLVMIDGCFLRCHGRVLRGLAEPEAISQFDALKFYRQYTDIFDADAVPEAERNRLARAVADGVITAMK